MQGRDNGLRAEAYIPLADLDPRLADAMLEVLRDSGIAAYAVPAGSEVSGHLGTHMPERPTDRLYVDAAATDPAWEVLRANLPSMDVEREGSGRDLSPGPRDEDEVWQNLVAAYHREPSDPVPPWPASEDIDHTDAGESAGEDSADPRDLPVSQERKASEQPSDDEHFVPPPPPPVPRPDPVTTTSWLCLFGGPTYLLLSTMVGWPIPGWAAFVAVAAFIGGFVALVVRMGDEPPPDSGPDDGAVV